MKVPYVNIGKQHEPIKAQLLEVISKVVDRGDFILGEEVPEFERRFAALCHVRFAIGLNSGTDSLVLALRALDIGPGDEVITVPNSFVASTSCIILAGAKPVFVDVREDYIMDPNQIEKAITPNTKGILPVHLTGHPADMDPIMQIARKYGLHVIEDCAQAVLAKYRDRLVGSFGIVNCFSLHPLKTLNACGDGGVLVTNDEEIFERIKVLRNLGIKARDKCVEWSDNSRLDTIQAAILLIKLNHLEEWTLKRCKNARYYKEHLKSVPQVKCPQEREGEHAVYHTFVIQAERRDELKRFLSEQGIGTAIHYPTPIHLHPAAAGLGYRNGDFPESERQAKGILSLPVRQDLQECDLKHVVDAIKAFYRT